ncbi:sigma-54 dependent transcriptional regulator [candidate division KSB1 bacterium]|nr:sigma-54 dependent transcriptional regulator [candidate division KSB1 bacterium]
MNPKSVFKVLVIEDNIHFANFLQDKLGEEYHLEVADNAEAALEKFQQRSYDLVLLDLGLPRRAGMPPEIAGFEILKHIKALDPTVEVIVLTGTSREIDSAIRAIKDGAYYFLIKDDFEIFAEKLHTTIQNALQKRILERNNRTLLKQAKYLAERQKRVHEYRHPNLNYHFGILIGESEPMQEIYTIIQKVSLRRPDETILICGESGTGKELVALSIHSQSPRGDRPWIVANIASLSLNLIESELFGIEPRTATEVSGKIGYFEQAEGTSIFLDEIGEVPAEMQVKLLRALQQKEIQRVGSTKPITVDTRVIAATNKNLKDLVQQGKFREDLYFRLDVISINLPPLRERREDIPLLIEHGLYSIQQEENNPNIQLSPDAIELLRDYTWPGNVRELQNVLKKAAILRNHDVLTAADFRKLLPKPTGVTASSSVLGSLPTLTELSPAGETMSFKHIRDEKLRHKILLRTLIEREGRMEEVLDELGIARNTGYKFLDEAQNLLLTGLCQANANVAQLAESWGVEKSKLEKTIRRAHRLSGYLRTLQERFANDQNRLAVFLNVKIEQLEKVGQYLGSL